jgi:methyl-accepting chemotaxis protein
MPALQHLRVRTRLTIGFATMVVLLLVIAAIGWSQMRRMAGEFEDVTDNIVPSLTVLSETQSSANQSRRHALRMLATQPQDLEAAAAELQASLAELGKRVADYQPLVVDDEDKRTWQATDAAARAYRESATALLGELRAAGQDETRREAVQANALRGEGFHLFAALDKAVRAQWTYNVKLADSKKQEGAAAQRDARVLMLSAIGAALVIALALAIVIARSVTRPLGAEPSELIEAARRVADGDLGAVRGADTASSGSVLAMMGTMQQSLVALVGQVRHSVDSIATASSEIAAGNADLSSRTEQQASALQETAAAMQQMTSTVGANADTARQANQVASHATSVATKGGEAVQRVVGMMESLTASSRKITDITGVIDGIAFQTNILALNAAVEAARAGEQGRGFAVVAGEVRILAQRCSEAAREIKGLIADSVERVADGSTLVNEAGHTMGEIVTHVKRVSDLINEISAATIEQSAGITQVNQAVTQLDHGTQQNAALVEEGAAAAESMRQQAQQLSEAIGVFRVDAASGAVSAPVSSAASAARAIRRPAPAALAARAGSAPAARRPATATPSSSTKRAVLVGAGGGMDAAWEAF